MDMNTADKPNLNDNLVEQLARKSNFGWMVALFFIVLSIFLFVYFTLKPTPVLGVDNSGFVVGQVLFDEAHYRSEDDILADLKRLTVKCVSVSKVTIYEDTSVCLTHMDEDLADYRYTQLIEDNTIKRIEQLGCLDADYQFDYDFTTIKTLNRDDLTVDATVKGSVICKDDGKPTGQDFYLSISADLVDRTSEYPLALKIKQLEDL